MWSKRQRRTYRASLPVIPVLPGSLTPEPTTAKASGSRGLAPVTLTRRTVIWLVPALLALHNAEEALSFPHYLPTVREHAPAVVRPIVAGITYPQMLVALGVATVLPFALAAWAAARPSSRTALWFVLLIQTVVLLNVATHAASAAFVARGYTPGLATALVLNLPFSLYVMRRCTRERWLAPRALWTLVPTAILVHGPVLVGPIALSGRLTDRAPVDPLTS